MLHFRCVERLLNRPDLKEMDIDRALQGHLFLCGYFGLFRGLDEEGQ